MHLMVRVKLDCQKIFKELIVPKNKNDDSESELARHKILYYNAFTEDLFYWDNDLAGDKEPKLKFSQIHLRIGFKRVSSRSKYY